jgi:putative ATPase
MSQTCFGFPERLTERYRPKRIADFAGLEKVKTVLSNLVRFPKPSAWLFVGNPGTGKTSMGLALANELRAELHHIPSQKCNAESVEDVVRRCWYVPVNGSFHVVLVDEADRMSNAAQLALLSKLDATGFPPATIFVFTCNETGSLEPRFLSRCFVLKFSTEGMRQPIAQLLSQVWNTEVGTGEDAPNFPLIAKESFNNVREALNVLELRMMEVA